MATLTRQEIGLSGLTPSFAAVGTTDEVLNDDDTFLEVKNTNAATRDVTITAQKTSYYKEGYGDVTVGNIVVTVGVTPGDKMIKAPPAFYNDANGKIQISYSATTGLTIAAFKLAKQ